MTDDAQSGGPDIIWIPPIIDDYKSHLERIEKAFKDLRSDPLENEAEFKFDIGDDFSW